MNTLAKSLEFAPSGKLEKLCLAGFPNLLHEWDQEVDMGNKLFCPSGWDECFPTIERYNTSPVMGELIGWSPQITWQADYVEQVWQSANYEARRRFSLETSTCLNMAFQVTNLQSTSMEFLWASHALFDVQSLVAVNLADGTVISDFELNESASKSFVANTQAIELIYSNFRVKLSSDQNWWGIWLNLGGWHPNNSTAFACIGIEATNTPSEHPEGQWLDANTTFVGKVKLEIYSEPKA